MSNGMSKFTKGCLITALVTFIIGLLMCGVGALMGGFRMLDGMDIEGITELTVMEGYKAVKTNSFALK